jgi:hypothetical protein
MTSIFGLIFDLSKANPFDVIKGCTEATLNFMLLQADKRKSKEVAEYRMSICRNCPLGQVNGVQCYYDESMTVPNVRTGLPTHGCTCLLACKTPLLNQSCPAEKWLTVE